MLSEGGVFYLVSTPLFDESSEYSLNSAVSGGVIKTVDSKATFKNSNFHDNYAYTTGVIFATS